MLAIAAGFLIAAEASERRDEARERERRREAMATCADQWLAADLPGTADFVGYLEQCVEHGPTFVDPEWYRFSTAEGTSADGGDLDCSDFDGPVYDQATNARHGLDADGDGVGCE